MKKPGRELNKLLILIIDQVHKLINSRENISILTMVWLILSINFSQILGLKLIKKIPTSHSPGGRKCYLNPRIPYSILITPTNPQEISDIIITLDGSK